MGCGGAWLLGSGLGGQRWMDRRAAGQEGVWDGGSARVGILGVRVPLPCAPLPRPLDCPGPWTAQAPALPYSPGHPHPHPPVRSPSSAQAPLPPPLSRQSSERGGGGASHRLLAASTAEAGLGVEGAASTLQASLPHPALICGEQRLLTHFSPCYLPCKPTGGARLPPACGDVARTFFLHRPRQPNPGLRTYREPSPVHMRANTPSYRRARMQPRVWIHTASQARVCTHIH